MLVLEKQNPELFADSGIDFFITNIGEGTALKSVELARKLRAQGQRVQYDVDQKKLKNQFKKADRVHAEFVITLGEKELAEGNVSIKRLADGKQIKLSWDEMNNISEAMKNF